MPITREELTGAIKLVNAAQLTPRIDYLKKLLLATHSQADVDRIVSDLNSYDAWNAGVGLDAPPPSPNA